MNCPPPVIEPIADEDLASLCTYLENYRGRHRGRQFWQSRFNHWWHENPFYKSGMVRGRLLRSGGNIVGFVGSIPVPVQINQQEVITFMSSSWGVEPKYRKQSMRLLSHLAKALRENGSPYLLNNPIANTDLYYKLLGFFQIPIRYTRKFTLFNGPLARLSCKLPVDMKWPRMLMSAVEKRLYPLPRSFSKLRVERLEKVGAEFDQLWQASRSQVVNTHVRNSAFVNWYCFGNREYNKKLLFGAYDGDRLTGFVIFRESMQAGGNFLECLDLWFDSSAPDTVTALFSYALRYSSVNYCHGIITFDYDGMAEWLAGCSSFEVEEKTVSGFYQLPGKTDTPFTMTESYFVFGEGDVGM